MTSYPLLTSPIARMRVELGLSRREAARRLGLPARHLAVLEMRSHEISPVVRRLMRERLVPSKFVQLSIWDALARLDEGEGVGRAAGRPSHVG